MTCSEDFAWPAWKKWAMRRLFKAGLLTSYVVPSEEGPHRKYYSLNEPGRSRLAESGKTWQSFASTMNDLLGEAA
jgi:PadR family transcriptional regulator PadR